MTDWNRPFEPGPVKLEYDKPGPCVTLPLDMVERLLECFGIPEDGFTADDYEVRDAVWREVDQVKRLG